jgi:hypothetical protein
MPYRTRFRLGNSGKERIKEYRTAREAMDAVADFLRRHGKRGHAEYLGRSARKPVSSAIRLLLARRNQHGMLVVAYYRAPRASEGIDRYRVDLWIDPSSKEILSARFSLLNRDRRRRAQELSGEQQEIAREIRDLFLQLPSWEVLRNMEADWFTVVSPQGKTIRLPKSPRRRSSAKPAAGEKI